MIELLINGIINNGDKIEQLQKDQKQICISGLLLTVSIFIVGKVVSKQEKQIKALEGVIKEIQSKGE